MDIKHNQHLIHYIIFIMGELANIMPIKEIFNIIDKNGLEGLKNEYKRFL